MKNNFKRLKIACYTSSVSMSIVSTLSPLLFLTFRENFGISYSLLGTLVLINFCTQLLVDLAFSFFSHKFNISLSVKSIPVLTGVGLILYAVSPFIFDGEAVYIGLAIGTVIFSAAAGLGEVLISPIIAEIPADDPDREMSKLHSVYAWGVVAVVIYATVFLHLFGSSSWQWLTLTFCAVPLFSFIMYSGVTIPEMKTPEKASGALGMLRQGGIWLMVAAIFLGGAAECSMSQWASSYLEGALGISKVQGDIFGVALFALALGTGRTLYSKIGKHIERVLLLGAIGAAVCYLLAALSSVSFIGLFACAFTGFCTSMLWPGSLVVASERYPSGGVFIYALMAAGGDLGASVAPQLIGIVTDSVISSEQGIALADRLGMAVEELGMKSGMLVGSIFPIIAIAVYAAILISARRRART